MSLKLDENKQSIWIIYRSKMYCEKGQSKIWRKNCKIEYLLKRKINIVLSDGKSKKCAGFVIFDISVPLNLGMK